jgi:hypothetical protein
MEPIDCFLLEPIPAAYRWLRRYINGDCPLQADNDPKYRYHCTFNQIEDGKIDLDGTSGERKVYKPEVLEWPHDDQRWPTHCGCGFQFPESAEYQLFYNVIYQDAAGRRFHIHPSEFVGVERAPAGAMWYADWYLAPEAPDGRALVVRCPANPDGSGVSDWMVDGPSTTNPAPAWSRTGVPPKVTAHPSIFVRAPHGFHGWLRDGRLVLA